MIGKLLLIKLNKIILNHRETIYKLILVIPTKA